ncbi:M56 family metallopeptidase [Aquimarina sp. 2201CG1-2-11]|uniref:M56 family metallopeptidase n=1 Tax=Aquimarina discodermiae TaxID=3231043 RepID=UPI0034630248
MINYILYIIIFQLLFLISYDLFHKKDTFFSLNRLYLLATSALSFVLPFIRVKSIQETIPEEYVIKLPVIVIGQPPMQETALISDTTTAVTQVINHSFNYFSLGTINWWLLIYGIVVAFMLFRFIQRVFKLRAIRKKASYHKVYYKTTGYNVYTIHNNKDAFSFFNAMYLGDQLTPKEKEQIIIHEIVHLRQKHTLDLLWFEFLKIIFWFNPLIYVYRSRIDTLHEYIADTKSVAILGKRKYYEQLLHTTFETEDIDFINQFFNQSLLKKRITMLQKPKSKTVAKFKYLLIIPVLGTMLVASSFSKNTPIDKNQSNTFSTSINTINANNMIKEKEKKVREQKSVYSISSIDSIKTEIPFREIEQSPTTKACQHIKDQKKQKECFSKEIERFIYKNFDIKAITPVAKVGTNRIYARFKIDKKGNTTDIQVRASDPELEKETKRVIELLPQMIPGEHKGEKVNVIYTLPLFLNIDKNKQNQTNFKSKEASNDKKERVANRMISQNQNLKAGYYIETGGFSSQKDLDNEMERLKKLGLQPNFYETLFGYFITYLASYPTLEEAKRMKASGMNGMYDGDLSITKVTIEVKKKIKSSSSIQDEDLLSDQLSNFKENNVQLGYYLITHVFKHKNYLEKGMENLEKTGLNAKYFKSPKDGYYYVYLERYDQIEDAKKMLLSNVNGTYYGDLYILKVN